MNVSILTNLLASLAANVSTALPWEPYTGGVKKAYDVGISKKLTGKNLLDCRGLVEQTINGVKFTPVYDGYGNLKYIEADGIPTANAIYNLSATNFKLDTAEEYVLTDGASTNNEDYYTQLFSGETNRLPNSVAGGGKFTPENVLYIARIIVKTAVSKVRFYPMLRLASIEDDTYEPYTEKTLTLNRVLRGIPLGTDIPEMFKSNALHMAGIYWDEKEQQYYIADTIDADRGVRVQRVGVQVFDGSEDEGWSLSSESRIIFATKLLKNAMSPVANKNEANMLCDSLITYPYYYYGDSGTNELYAVTDGISLALGGSLCVRMNSIIEIVDLASFKAHLAENPITVVYELATPIETPLTDEEIIAYKTLHSNKPTTIITNDAGCFMEVEYVADTKNHIAQNYVPVTAFNDVLDRISALERLHV